MPTDTALDDDYIFDLLQKDALNVHSRTAKRDKNAPRPNTRFLKHIVKEADNHNAALLAKEHEESKARLSDLKRKREAGAGREEKRRKEGERNGRWASAFGGLGGRVGGGEVKRVEKKDPRTERRQPRDLFSNERHRDEDDRQSDRKHKRRRSDPRLSRSKSRSPDFKIRGHHRSHHTSPTKMTEQFSPTHDDEDSDPLDPFLGPAPPSHTRPRGRGRPSTLDLRFNDPSYDPRTDVAQEEDSKDSDDWGTSLEAIRDRAIWRAQGASRLREAGFSEKDVQGREKGGREKDDRDVRWAGKGEGREWDRGKVVDGKGGVEGKAAWTMGLGLGK